jgi:ParB family chromosome partitioning protein
LLDDLAQAKLNAIRADLEAEGWQVVEVAEGLPHDIYSRGYLRPEVREPNEAEAAQLAELDAKIEALENEGHEYGEEAAELFDQREAITESLKAFSAEQKANGGIFAYIGHSGEMAVRHWPIVIEQPTAKVEETGPYAASMIERLTAIRTMALQQEVAAQPALALDILLDTLAAQLLHGVRSYELAADIVPTVARHAVEQDMIDNSNLAALPSQMVERFADIPSEGRFETIRTMQEADKMQLLATLVATSINGTIFAAVGSRQAIADKYAAAAGLDLAKHWTPDRPF